MHTYCRTLALGSVLALVAGAPGLLAQSTDRAVGTWRLNVAKSKYEPGPPPRSMTVTYETVGQGIRVVAKGLDARGGPFTTQYTANYDGKDYPVTVTGATSYDTVALRQMDTSTVEATRKKGGKIVQTLTRMVSSDGKTLTMTVKGTGEKGRPYNDVAVLEK